MSTDTKREGEGTNGLPVESVIECPTECQTCNGTGTIYPPTVLGLNVTGGIKCPKCDGGGKV